jgi:hypothetical protein
VVCKRRPPGPCSLFPNCFYFLFLLSSGDVNRHLPQPLEYRLGKRPRRMTAVEAIADTDIAPGNFGVLITVEGFPPPMVAHPNDMIYQANNNWQPGAEPATLPLGDGRLCDSPDSQGMEWDMWGVINFPGCFRLGCRRSTSIDGRQRSIRRATRCRGMEGGCRLCLEYGYR